MAGATLLSTNPDRSLLWNQFLAHSESFRQFGLADKLPTWVTPSSPDVLGLRSFFHPAWYAPIGLLILGQFLTRVESFGLYSSYLSGEGSRYMREAEYALG